MVETQIPKTMKAAVVEKHGQDLVIKEVPVPEPGPGQVLIKVIASGLCHTDIHVRDGDWHVVSKTPVIPGHEGAGVVAAVGEGVKGLKIGDRVGHAWLHDSCGTCEYCITGREAVCSDQHQTGFFADGCFSEYTLAEAKYVGRIPDGLSYAQAAPILCAGVTTYKALKETECKPGQWVAIIGATGGLGHVACQYAAAMGFKVCAIDYGDEKKDYALNELGCKAFVNSKGKSSEQTVAAVKEACDGMGAHGSVVLAPVNQLFRDATDMLRPYGTCVGIALPPGDFPVDIFTWILHRKTVRGSIVGTVQDLNEALTIAADYNIKCTVQERKLEEINDLIAEVRKGIKGRIVMRIAPDE